MSAIAATIGGPRAPDDAREGSATVERMVQAAGERWDGSPRSVARDGAAVAAGARTAAGECCLLHADTGVLVVADADLVRRGALRSALAGAGRVVDPDASDAALIAAAWRAWGSALAGRLDGDYALVIVDFAARRYMALRDPVGRRPLHWGVGSDGTLLIASTVGAVRAHPACDGRYDRAAMAAMAAGLFEHVDETPYAAIRVLPAGFQLTAAFGGPPQVCRWWSPPVFGEGRAISFADAAAELRDRLAAAVSDRMAPNGATAVWLSGGWDSTAVYGTAATLAAGPEAFPNRTVRAVSMSYPVGDAGREDEMIAAVAAGWGDTPAWVQIDDVPLLQADLDAEADRDEPFAHAYDGWNGALARATRAAGATVALDGAGGDQLFASTPVFLADFVRRGQLRAAWTAARAHGVTRGSRRDAAWAWWRWAVRPLTAPAIRTAMGALRGGSAPLGHLERPIPPWIRGGAGGMPELRRRARGFQRRGGESATAAEARWYLTSPYAGRILSAQSAVALREGVVLRSPLLDRRVLELAASRPASERAEGGETKRLLRAAVAGVLPEHVLAARPSRTGLSSTYFRRELRRHLPRLLETAGDAELLAALGVVDPGSLRASASEWQAGRASDDIGLAILLTMRTELWLRGRAG